jgi:BirA family transcriptional regulator, biotin operon repressor / biotin---[acetyl-CoA-carboxylase] ligase
LSTAAACLHEMWPGMDAAQALARVLPGLVALVKGFEMRGFAPYKMAFEQRDGLRGLQVNLSDGQTGLASGVDENGSLLVHTSAGLQKISSSEVSVRPA